MTLLLQAAATLYMTGVIWMVQVAHYPLFARIDAASFPDYEQRYTRRMGWVVAPAMLAELGLAGAMAFAPPAGVSLREAWLGLGLLAIIWLSTFLLQVPCHTRLSRGFDEATWRRLVRSNWIRTAAWTLRAALLLRLLAKVPMFGQGLPEIVQCVE